jgi:hypothetical protein
MTTGQDTEQTLNWYDTLKEDMPLESFQSYTSGHGDNAVNLTSIKPQYIKDRLNKLFGPFGWCIKGDFIEDRREDYLRGVLFRGELIIGGKGFPLKSTVTSVCNHQIETEGYNFFKGDLGECYMGARTRALSKAASYLGIGHSVFIGDESSEKIEHEFARKQLKMQQGQEIQDRWDRALQKFKTNFGMEMADLLAILEANGMPDVTRSTVTQEALDVLLTEYSKLEGRKFNAES